MCNEFDDYEMEDEFTAKVKELISEEVKNKITETSNELERYRKAYEDVMKRNNELYVKVNLHGREMEKAIREIKLSDKREMCGGYVVGDTFYYAEQTSEIESCKSCNGSGKVVAVIASEEMIIKCPMCRGEGNTQKWILKPRKDLIKSVHLAFYEKSGNPRPTYYGSNSGSSERQKERMHENLESCKAYCDEKNTAEVKS